MGALDPLSFILGVALGLVDAVALLWMWRAWRREGERSGHALPFNHNPEPTANILPKVPPKGPPPKPYDNRSIPPRPTRSKQDAPPRPRHAGR